MAILRLHSLNVQAFVSADKQREFIHFARSHHCDLLYVHETNFSCTRYVQDLNARFGVVSFFSFSLTLFTGIGTIVFNPSLLPGSFCYLDADGQATKTLIFLLGSQRYCIIIIYAPAIAGLCYYFFDALCPYCVRSDPIILCGDFDCVCESTAMFVALAKGS